MPIDRPISPKIATLSNQMQELDKRLTLLYARLNNLEAKVTTLWDLWPPEQATYYAEQIARLSRRIADLETYHN